MAQTQAGLTGMQNCIRGFLHKVLMRTSITYTTNVTGSHTTADLLQHVILTKAGANAVDGTTAVHTDAAIFL